MGKFCPECGTATKQKFVSGRERDACPNCDFVQYSKTKIGVGALVFRDESVLLVERIAPPHGLWTLPSGHQEENETLEMAVIREAWEETGMKVHPRGIVFLRNMLEHGAMDMYSVFLCDSDPTETPFVNDDESSTAQFIAMKDFDSIDIEPDSRWFIETYLNLQPEPMTVLANPFKHLHLQIFATPRTRTA